MKAKIEFIALEAGEVEAKLQFRITPHDGDGVYMYYHEEGMGGDKSFDISVALPLVEGCTTEAESTDVPLSEIIKRAKHNIKSVMGIEE